MVSESSISRWPKKRQRERGNERALDVRHTQSVDEGSQSSRSRSFKGLYRRQLDLFRFLEDVPASSVLTIWWGGEFAGFWTLCGSVLAESLRTRVSSLCCGIVFALHQTLLSLMFVGVFVHTGRAVCTFVWKCLWKCAQMNVDERVNMSDMRHTNTNSNQFSLSWWACM